MTSINDLATAAIASSTPGDTQSVSNGTRGAFIVLEGLDRSGKTTQVKLLEQRFVEEGRSVKTMRFPSTSSYSYLHTRLPSSCRTATTNELQIGQRPSGR